jgi:S1-C subfamily serine protease
LNLVDLAIVVALIFALSSGFRRGFWLSLSQYVGLLLGVLVGAALAPPLLSLLHIDSPSAKSLGALAILVVSGTVGSTLGYWMGEPIRARLVTGQGRFDRAAGAAFSAIALLAVAWFLGLSLARGPSPALARLIQHSAILRRLDAIAPRPPAFLAQVESILSGVNLPSAFSGFEPFFQPPLQPIPTSVDTAGVRAAQARTVQVVSPGCGGLVFGSGFPVAPDYVLTNAHVVAGTRATRVNLPGGGSRRATVVLFDPNRDVAILEVPGLGLSPLTGSDAARGSQAAAIGYPGGGAERVSPAVIDGAVQAEGRDIYGQNLVIRQIWVLEAVGPDGQPGVQPGNSGGPLVDTDGNVLGVIFAASTSQPGQAYALTDSEVAGDISAAEGRTAPVGVGDCAL